MSPAPYQSCVSCYRGDTPTGVAFEGEAEYIIAAIHKAAAISLGEAQATFLVLAEHELGCDPGMVPAGDVTVGVRLCRKCARRAGIPVGNASKRTMPLYKQPEDLRFNDG